MAREKAEALSVAPDEALLCADTTVYSGRRVLGKPADAAEARRFLLQLSGGRHRIVTGVALRTGDRIRARDVVSTVRMKRLSDAEVDAYIATNEWQGKAGGYGIQGAAGALIPWMRGSYSAIVGLPLAETAALLNAAGLRARRAA
jgi:septum formation protein